MQCQLACCRQVKIELSVLVHRLNEYMENSTSSSRCKHTKCLPLLVLCDVNVLTADRANIRCLHCFRQCIKKSAQVLLDCTHACLKVSPSSCLYNAKVPAADKVKIEVIEPVHYHEHSLKTKCNARFQPRLLQCLPCLVYALSTCLLHIG